MASTTIIVVSKRFSRETSATLEAVLSAAEAEPWVGLQWPGEVDEYGVLAAALALADSLPDSTSGLTVRRREGSRSGWRETDVLRILRPTCLRAMPSSGDHAPAISGSIAPLDGKALLLDRSAAQGPTAYASTCEARGDWTGAAAAWKLAAEEPSAFGAWCRMRQAVAVSMVAPTAPAVQAGLAEALGRNPGMPEAAGRLAAYACATGNPRDALRWLAVADALSPRLSAVPHPEGAGTWYVHALAAELTAPFDEDLARRSMAAAQDAGFPLSEAMVLGALLRPPSEPTRPPQENHHGRS